MHFRTFDSLVTLFERPLRVALVLLGILALPVGALAQIVDSEPANDTRPGAPPLGLLPGQIVHGSLTLSEKPGDDDVDYFPLVLQAGQIVTAITSPTEVWSEVPDTRMFIEDALGNELVDNHDAGQDEPDTSEYGSVVRLRAPVSGTYYLGVTATDTGSYDLCVSLTGAAPSVTLDADPANDSAAGAHPLEAPGQLVIAQLVSPADTDYYAVQARAGDVLTAVTTPLGGDLDAPDTVIAIRDAGGAELVLSDDDGADFPDGRETGSAVRLLVPEDGTYYVVVGSEAGEVGLYALMVCLPGGDAEPSCSCWPDGLPSVNPVACYRHAGPRIDTFALFRTRPALFVQVTDRWCRANARFRFIAPAERDACELEILEECFGGGS